MNEAQKTELAIFKCVRKILEENNLRYYAIGGTLLGAVRDKGFIPWDDDIDIAVPRPDYDRFLEIARTALPSSYELVTYHGKNKAETPVYQAQVQDLNSEVVVEMANEGRSTHLWIDVFPLDAMPSNGLLRTLQKYRLLYMRMKVNASNFDAIVHQHRANRPFHERALIKFCELTSFAQNEESSDLLAKTEKAAKRYDYEREDYVVNLWGVYKFREMFPKAWMGEGVELPFEDTTITCPSCYDDVLTQMYGDYMTPISEDERSAQHCMTVISSGKNSDDR